MVDSMVLLFITHLVAVVIYCESALLHCVGVKYIITGSQYYVAQMNFMMSEYGGGYILSSTFPRGIS